MIKVDPDCATGTGPTPFLLSLLFSNRGFFFLPFPFFFPLALSFFFPLQAFFFLEASFLLHLSGGGGGGGGEGEGEGEGGGGCD